jgi:hypothetical protein
MQVPAKKHCDFFRFFKHAHRSLRSRSCTSFRPWRTSIITTRRRTDLIRTRMEDRIIVVKVNLSRKRLKGLRAPDSPYLSSRLPTMISAIGFGVITVFFLLALPTRSPELNPIDLIWKILVQGLKTYPLAPVQGRPHAVAYASCHIMREITHDDVAKCYKHCNYLSLE